MRSACAAKNQRALVTNPMLFLNAYGLGELPGWAGLGCCRAVGELGELQLIFLFGMSGLAARAYGWLMVLSLKNDKCKEDPLLLTDLLSRLLVCLALD